MSAQAVSVSTEFDIFATRQVQTTLDTTETTYKPIAEGIGVFIPADHDTYIDLNIHLQIRGKLTKEDGAELDATDYKAVTNNFLHSLLCQCSINLKGVSITPAAER
jgi:hypothetical protein